MHLPADLDALHAAVESGDPRFDGQVVLAVTTTGIYCRPSCPARTPLPRNRRFYRTAAAAVRDGYRACRRCAPDTTPDDPEWDVRGDLAARALRLVADGVVDRAGVGGLAASLAVSERHLSRVLRAEVGAGPLALARSRRAAAARTLLERTEVGLAQVARAAGFGSVRQMSATLRQTYAVSPGALRGTGARGGSAARVTVRLPARGTVDVDALLGWISQRCIPQVEEVTGATLTRTLVLPGGPATVTVALDDRGADLTASLSDLADLSTAVRRVRDLLDLDADLTAPWATLRRDRALRPLVDARPWLRLPGSVDGWESALRAVVGQQVSVSSARATLGRLTATFGDDAADPSGVGRRRLVPTARRLAVAAVGDLPMPAARATTLRSLAALVATGALALHRGADRAAAREALLAVAGVGPWTAEMIALRALRDPDAFPAADLGLRRAAARLGLPDDPRGLAAHAERWRPWRAYAAQHLWTLPHHQPRASHDRSPR